MLTQEVKCHAVLIALSANHSDLETASFRQVAKSSVYKVRAELVCCGGDVGEKEKAQSSETPDFLLRQVIVGDDPGKAMLRRSSVSQSAVRLAVHEWHLSSCVTRRGAVDVR